MKWGSMELQPPIQRPIRGEKWSRLLWGATIFLALIGVAVVLRRTFVIVPVLLNGYQPPATTGSMAQVAALDDSFARYSLLTLVHILPGLLFMILGPLQFVSTIRRRYPKWHRWSGRVYLVCSLVIGLTAL